MSCGFSAVRLNFRRHSGARLLARTRNPFLRLACCTMDSGFALRAPRNDSPYLSFVNTIVPDAANMPPTP
ncbi:hypothetical protein CWO91_00935 [Bradyrhizobium genosp. SA-3]|nr:hypothetical protein CWO91_00935 [Bradyrhizobium genosp. SA-3]